MLQFERVSLHLGTLCGAIPLDNFLANDYDDAGGLDYYREFEKEDIRYQERTQDDNAILDSDSEESEGSDVEGDDVMQMLLSVDDPTEEDRGEENGSANRAPSLHGNAERDSRASDDGSLPMPQVIGESEADGSRHGDPLQSNAAMRREAALEKLHMACTRLSGTVEALRFEFIEEGPSEIKCILTVTIPVHTGVSTRSYSTHSPFSTRSDAKGEAARIAIDMGVIDFIKSASSSSSANITRDRAALLARVLENQTSFQLDLEAGARAVQDIARLCREWRVGVTPEYILYRQRKGKERETGCALRIALTSHAMKVFSTSTEFSDPEVARMACALIAQEEGVLDYIRYGNGQKAKPQQSGPPVTVPKVPSYTQMSVQEFFEALPRPFVEPIDEGKSASEIQWANMLNMIIQGAKMHGLKTMFYFTDTETRTGLTGCILRVVVSDPSVLSIVSASGKEVAKTFVVDPHFVKTNDAKTAACMVAITQNLRGFLTDISKTYEEATQHSRDFDRRVSEVTLRTMTKLMKGKAPVFEYTNSVKPNGFGCSLTIDLSSNPEEPDKRTFSTQSSHYGSKPDARIAALVEAAKGGVIELLLFRTAEDKPPAGYRKFWDVVSQELPYVLPSTQEDPENGKAQKRKRKRNGVQKSGTNSENVKAGAPANGSEPGEISDNDAPSPTKRAVPSRIRRSMSALLSKPSITSAEPTQKKTGNGASVAPGTKPRRRPPPPNVHPPSSQRLHYGEPKRHFDPPPVQGNPVPSYPPRSGYHHPPPPTHARPPIHLAIPPHPQDYSYPETSPYSGPPDYTPSPAPSRYDSSPYPFSPSLAYQAPPPHPQPHAPPPPPPSLAQHTHGGYPYPYSYPEPHPPPARHDHYPHRPPSPPHPGYPHEHQYPAQYPHHMIPRKMDRSKDYRPYQHHQDDYPRPDPVSEEAWRHAHRHEQDPRYFEPRGRYERPAEPYPY